MKLKEFVGTVLLCGAGVHAAAFVPNDTGNKNSWDADHENNQTGYSMKAAAPLGTGPLIRTGWKVTCDSQHLGNECDKAIDNSSSSFWHTGYGSDQNINLPHTITLDMGRSHTISGISSLPRQDDQTHGFIAQHEVYVSTDGKNWGSPVAYGNWYFDNTQKFANFEPQNARYVRLVALSEGFGLQYSSIADLNVYQATSSPGKNTGLGSWGPTLDFPVVPVAGAVEPTSGKVVVWSAYKDDEFLGTNQKVTLTAEYDPVSGNISTRQVTNTDHDMFCPGISMDGNGQIVVTGGNNAARTSIFDSASDSWISGPDMIVQRGYQGSATCSDGRVFTIGGSWSGGRFLKNGEIYDPNANKWTMLDGALVKPMLTNDPQGIFRADNHAWLFGWKNGTLFQAGPSTAMNWYYTNGNGSVKSAGQRKSSEDTDPDSMCGNAIMFDATKGSILAVGGSPAYQDEDATNHAHLITIGEPGSQPTVSTIGNGMHYSRIFANSVVLPDGNVFITGGQHHGNPFFDTTPVLTPELYLAENNTFIDQQPNSIVRVYHSISMLLPDATVFSGGGGLCGNCSYNHFDAQIFTPQYLLNSDGSKASRPSITSVSANTVKVGSTLTFKTSRAIASASFIRYGTVTHSLNTDQRRVPLQLKHNASNTYSSSLPTDPGILLPGYWMLFVLDKKGRPSNAATIKVTLQ